MLKRKLFAYFTGLLIFCVLPLVGWGLNDVPGFFHNRFRLAYVVMMAGMSAFVVVFVPNEGRGSGEGNKLVSRQKISLLFLQIIPPIIILVSPFFDHKRIAVFYESDVLRLIGLVVTFAGFSFMNWSIMVLGKQFSVDVTIQEDHKLVTQGPYKYIRHPRYLGIILFFTGISLLFLSWIGLLLILSLILVLIWRISDEEALMEAEFGNAWKEYRRKTSAFLPFIY